MQLESEAAMLDKLIAWGKSQPLVRAMLLTSTRAVPGAQPDRLSDYDLVLVLTDITSIYGMPWLPPTPVLRCPPTGRRCLPPWT